MPGPSTEPQPMQTSGTSTPEPSTREPSTPEAPGSYHPSLQFDFCIEQQDESTPCTANIPKFTSRRRTELNFSDDEICPLFWERLKTLNPELASWRNLSVTVDPGKSVQRHRNIKLESISFLYQC